PPFRGSTALAVLRHVSDQAPPPIRALNPNLPAWLEELIMRLMANDPAQRIQSAAEVASLLECYLAHLRQPAAMDAPQLPASAVRVRVRPPLPYRFGLAAILVVLAVLGLGRWFLGGNNGPPAEKEKKPRAEFYQDFRGGKLPPEELTAWAGKEGNETI